MGDAVRRLVENVIALEITAEKTVRERSERVGSGQVSPTRCGFGNTERPLADNAIEAGQSKDRIVRRERVK